jgi:putative transposase
VEVFMSDVEAALRREAARRRLAGESPETIAADLGRTRQWVAKWAARYDPHDPSWADGRSRAPKRVANRTPEHVEAQVLAVRERLAENPWAQLGSEAIAWELQKLGGPVPPLRTIEEILARAGVTRTGRVSRRRTSKGLPYPTPEAKRLRDVVQADLIGPRHLHGGVRFHALTQIDVASHHAGVEIITDRGDQRVLGALHALWERHGLPRRLQFDNGGPFVSPTGLGEVVRVCLHQRITLVFIPPREPWRNGTIEHFNNTFQQRFFRQEHFDGLPHLIERTTAFERFHNSQHRYSSSGGRTPEQSTPTKPRMPLPAEEIPTGWPERGRIEFIRFIRSDERLRVLGRSIPMPGGTAYQYVTATLDLSLTDQDNLLISDTEGELLTTARLSTPRQR